MTKSKERLQAIEILDLINCNLGEDVFTSSQFDYYEDAIVDILTREQEKLRQFELSMKILRAILKKVEDAELQPELWLERQLKKEAE